MSFFDSDVVRAEMVEISELQEEVYDNVFKFPTMSREDQQYHVELIEKLLDKQKIMYTRLSLSDDPDAQNLKRNICEAAVKMGLPPNIDINILFSQMSQMISMMRQHIENTPSR